MLLILLLGGMETWRRWKARKSPESREFHRVPRRTRLIVAGVYIGLALALALGVDATHLERSFSDVIGPSPRGHSQLAGGPWGGRLGGEIQTSAPEMQMDADDTQDEGREHTGPEDPTQPMGAQGGYGRPAPRKLVRAREGRMLGGVCAGLGRYFNVDPILFRIGAVALVLLGGAGVLLYLAALILVPAEPEGSGTPASAAGRSIGLVVGVIVLLLIGWPFLLGGGLIAAAVLVPVATLVIAGVLVWWLVSGEGPSGDGAGHRPPSRARRRGPPPVRGPSPWEPDSPPRSGAAWWSPSC